MKRHGILMTHLPQPVKDTLLLVLTIGVLVGVAFQVKQNNTVATTCRNRKVVSAQSQADRQNLLMAFQLFVDLTRRRRSDPTSSSYDPSFVRGIDTQIQPLLDLVDPYRAQPPLTC